jgi:hypothetical protein
MSASCRPLSSALFSTKHDEHESGTERCTTYPSRHGVPLLHFRLESAQLEDAFFTRVARLSDDNEEPGCNQNRARNLQKAHGISPSELKPTAIMTDVGTVWTVGVPATAARYFAPNTRPFTTAPAVRAVALHCATSPSTNRVMTSGAMVFFPNSSFTESGKLMTGAPVSGSGVNGSDWDSG